MSKRKYAHIKEIESELLAMRNAGCTQQEIADHFGLEKSQIKNWINHYNREQDRYLDNMYYNTLFVGMDVHKETFTLCCYDM